MSTVKDVTIDDDYITVKSNDTVIEVAKAIAKAGVPDAVVIDEKGHVLGVLDDYDIVSKVLAEEKDPKVVKAEDIMYAPPPVKLETELKAVHDILQELEATILPVVDEEKKLIGVITIMDVLDGLMEQPPGMFDWITGLFKR